VSRATPARTVSSLRVQSSHAAIQTTSLVFPPAIQQFVRPVVITALVVEKTVIAAPQSHVLLTPFCAMCAYLCPSELGDDEECPGGACRTDPVGACDDGGNG